jgi:hypothetical protein
LSKFLKVARGFQKELAFVFVETNNFKPNERILSYRMPSPSCQKTHKLNY